MPLACSKKLFWVFWDRPDALRVPDQPCESRRLPIAGVCCGIGEGTELARMPAGHGLRSRTRDTFSRGFRQNGYINLTTYLRAFRLGDYVDIKVNSAVHKVPYLPCPTAPVFLPIQHSHAQCCGASCAP